MINLFKKKEESILDKSKFSFPEDRKKEVVFKEGFINYIRLPLAEKSKMSLLFSFLALICMIIAVKQTLAAQGNADLTISSWVFSSLVFSIAGLFYAGFSFREKGVKYFAAYIGLVISGLQFITWSIIILIGQTT